MHNVKNNALSKLVESIDSIQTEIQVESVASFPQVPFFLTINDSVLETVEVTEVSENTLTVVRGVSGTVAGSHEAGRRIELRVMAEHVIDLQENKAGKDEKNTYSEKNVFDGGIDVNGDVVVHGNVYQQGEPYITKAEELKVKKSLITVREDAETGLGLDGYAGLLVKNYNGENDGMLVIDRDGYMKVGDVGDLQTLLTREDEPTNEGILFWNDALKRAETSSGLIFDGDKLEIDADVDVAQRITVDGQIWANSTGYTDTTGALRLSSGHAVSVLSGELNIYFNREEGGINFRGVTGATFNNYLEFSTDGEMLLHNRGAKQVHTGLRIQNTFSAEAGTTCQIEFINSTVANTRLGSAIRSERVDGGASDLVLLTGDFDDTLEKVRIKADGVEMFNPSYTNVLTLKRVSNDSNEWGIRVANDNQTGRGRLAFVSKDEEEKLTITKVGNVGIGIEIAEEKLEVDGNAKIHGDIEVTGNMQVDGNATISELTLDTLNIDDLDVDSIMAKDEVHLYNDGEAQDFRGLRIQNSFANEAGTATEIAFINSDVGTAINRGSIIRSVRQAHGGSDLFLFTGDGSTSKEKVRIHPDGVRITNAEFQNILELFRDTVTPSRWGFRVHQDTPAGAGRMTLRHYDEPLFYFEKNGSLGFGGVPDEKLHVDGNIKADGTIIANSLEVDTFEMDNLVLDTLEINDNINMLENEFRLKDEFNMIRYVGEINTFASASPNTGENDVDGIVVCGNLGGYLGTYNDSRTFGPQRIMLEWNDDYIVSLRTNQLRLGATDDSRNFISFAGGNGVTVGGFGGSFNGSTFSVGERGVLGVTTSGFLRREALVWEEDKVTIRNRLVIDNGGKIDATGGTIKLECVTEMDANVDPWDESNKLVTTEYLKNNFQMASWDGGDGTDDWERESNMAPEDYAGNKIIWEFKDRDAIASEFEDLNTDGVRNGGLSKWASLLTIALGDDADVAGHQLGFTADGNIANRVGGLGQDSWSSWKTLAHVENDFELGDIPFWSTSKGGIFRKSGAIDFRYMLSTGTLLVNNIAYTGSITQI